MKQMLKQLFAKQLVTFPIGITGALAFLTIITGIVLYTKEKPQHSLEKQPVHSVLAQHSNKNKKEEEVVIDDKKYVVYTPSPTPVITATPIPQTQQPVPTSTPLPQATPTKTPDREDTISVEINEPDGNGTFSLAYHDGSTPCSILSDAKNDGKLRSLTISHYDSLNSDYIAEMNGYKEGWIFAVNHIWAKVGCSHYIVAIGDTVTWQYK